MKRRYLLSLSAENDLLEIWYFTLERWGEAQAEKYLEQLESRFLELASDPQKGRLRPEITPDYFSFREARHVIFYCQHHNGIAIARVLHESMDLAERMDEKNEKENWRGKGRIPGESSVDVYLKKLRRDDG